MATPNPQGFWSIAKETIKGIPAAAKNYASGIVNADIGQALGQPNLNNTPGGIAINTGLGLPKATKETFLPGRGYSDKQLADANPNFWQSAQGIPKVAAELTSAVGSLPSLVPGYDKQVNKFTSTPIGGKLADVGAAIQDYSVPKNAEEARSMRVVDALTLAPIGSTKNIVKEIVNVANMAEAARLAKTAGVPEHLIQGAAKSFLEARTPQQADAALKAFQPTKVPTSPAVAEASFWEAAPVPKESPTVTKATTALEEAKINRELIGDVVSGHPGKGVGGAINARRDEFVKGGDVQFQNRIGQELSGGDDLDVLQKYRDEFKSIKASEVQAKEAVAVARRDLTAAKAEHKALMQTEKFLTQNASKTNAERNAYDLARNKEAQQAVTDRIKMLEEQVKAIPTQKTTTGAQTKRVVKAVNEPGAGNQIVTTDKKLLTKQIRDEARGAKFAAKDIRGEVRRRRTLIKAIRDTFGLTDGQMRKATKGKDFRFMGSREFQDFLGEVDKIATLQGETNAARMQIEGTIQYKELQRTENLRKAMALPPVSEMNTAQLKQFDEVLSNFELGDEFLSKRKLEMIDKTVLEGAKTIREAREALAKKLGVPMEELAKIKVGEFDRFRWDTSLAERNPFYKFMVEGFSGSILEGDARLLELQRTTDKLMGEARKGSSLLRKVIPTDEKIFNYLSAVDKTEIAKTMTPAELKAAEFMRKEFSDALAYQYEQGILGKSSYEDSYITNIRRGFFEALKDDGLKSAFKEMFDQYKQDEAVLDIMDKKTGNILPLEKFFQFALQRSGNLNPTKNVSKAFLTYMRTFERKKALDRIIPEVMTYVDVLTPQEMTKRGLISDDKLKSFVTEYLNTKKGRSAQLFVKPGGKGDAVLRSLKAFTNVMDLAVNVPIQLSSNAGVQTGLYSIMGAKRYALGSQRLAMAMSTKKGREFLQSVENYTGRNPWEELLSTTKGVPEKVYDSMFILFRDAVTRGNQQHLLGSLTKEEWSSMKVSPERMAEMRTELGRWLPVEGAKSVLGATTEGSLATQYKTWAIPPLRTATKNLIDLGKMLKDGKNPLKSREFWELFRVAQVGATVSLITLAIANEVADKPQTEQTMVDKMINKVLRDAMSMVSAIDPQTYTSVPRTLSFTTNLAKALSDLIRLEEYTSDGAGYKEGDLKGLKNLQKVITPAPIKGAYAPAMTPAEKRLNEAEKVKTAYRDDVVRPIYENVQALVNQGDTEEAQVIVDKLSDEDYEIYKSIKSAEKTKATKELQETLLPVYDQIQTLVDAGDTQQAQALLDAMSDEEYRAYGLLKKKLQ